jgi:Fe-S cluster biogenesis protein NfuA
MFIQTEATPNPLSLKFLPGKVIHEAAPLFFQDVRQTMGCPLAARLLSMPDVESVFIGHDFITIGKSVLGDWVQMKPQILEIMVEAFASDRPLWESHEQSEMGEGESDPIVRQIKEILEIYVRPAVANDGGDISFDRFDPEEGVLYVQMQGACSGCPSSTVTLKNGIENMMRYYVPEVKEVRQHVEDAMHSATQEES